MADVITFWHPYRDQALDSGYFAWGSVPAGSSADLPFRLHNSSTTATAAGVTVSTVDTGTTASPSVAAQHLLSTDGQHFTATLSLGDLPPAVSTAVLWLRRVTPADAQTGTFTFTVRAQIASWA